MAAVDGFEDLQARQIIEWLPGGKALIVLSGQPTTVQCTANPTGSLGFKRVEPIPIDQTEEVGLPKRVPVAERWAGTDQMRDGRAVQ